MNRAHHPGCVPGIAPYYNLVISKLTMTSELQHLKQKIRRLEAGGEPNLALRREYNAKLQAHRDGAAHLSGGGKYGFKLKQVKTLQSRVDDMVHYKADKTDVEELKEFVKNTFEEQGKINRQALKDQWTDTKEYVELKVNQLQQALIKENS